MKSVAAWSAVVGAIVLIAYAGGCSLDEMIRVDVAREVRETTGAPPQVTLREARDLLEDYDAKTQTGRDRLIREINDGAFIEQLGAGLVNDGVERATPLLGNVPGGAILTGLLGAIAGYVTRRPSKKQLDAEYDAGREEAIDTVNRAKTDNN